jgi:hypothetical protein
MSPIIVYDGYNINSENIKHFTTVQLKAWHCLIINLNSLFYGYFEYLGTGGRIDGEFANMFYSMLMKVIYVTNYKVLSEFIVFRSPIMRAIPCPFFGFSPI